MVRLPFVLCILAAFGGLSLSPDSADATRVRAMTTDQLVDRSALIVEGRVLSQQVIWDAERQRIYTDSVVLVSQTHLGVAPRSLTVRQIGGTLGQTTQKVAGVQPLPAGMEVLLFLRTDGVRFYVTGLSQGRYRVAVKDGERLLHRDSGGVTAVGKAPPQPPGLPLSVLTSQILTRATATGRISR